MNVGSSVVLPSASLPLSLTSLTSFSDISGFLAEFPVKVTVFSTPPESTSDCVIRYVALYVAVSPTIKFPTDDEAVAETKEGPVVMVREFPNASFKVSAKVRFCSTSDDVLATVMV